MLILERNLVPDRIRRVVTHSSRMPNYVKLSQTMVFLKSLTIYIYTYMYLIQMILCYIMANGKINVLHNFTVLLSFQVILHILIKCR